ncbi:MAG: ATP-binding protein [Collinsella aerofaciens]
MGRINITRGSVPRPQKVCIYGPEGVGKTTLAAQFPDPLFIDTEGGTEGYDVARTQAPQSWTALKDLVRAVAAERPCGTLVLDTADWAERLLCAELCAKNKWASMEALNYGKCWQYALEEFGRLLDLLTDVRDAGMNVVVTAHATVSKFDQPDEAASYDRWTMKMYKKDAALLKEWADALLFVNYKTVVEMVGEGFNAKGKARGAKRTIFTTHHAAWDAKNRWGLPAEVPLGYEAIAPHVPSPPPRRPRRHRSRRRAAGRPGIRASTHGPAAGRPGTGTAGGTRGRRPGEHPRHGGAARVLGAGRPAHGARRRHARRGARLRGAAGPLHARHAAGQLPGRLRRRPDRPAVGRGQGQGGRVPRRRGRALQLAESRRGRRERKE